VIYDAIILGTDLLDVSATQILGTAISTPATAGILDVNTKNINNVAAATPGAAGGVFIAGTNVSATITGTLTVSDGVVITRSTANQSAVKMTGNGSGHGVEKIAGATGIGDRIIGGSTSGPAMYLQTSGGASDGGLQISAVPGKGIWADMTGDITGNLSGSVGSVTGAVGSVTGAVGSVTGSVGSVTAGVTLAASAVQAIWDALTSALTTAGSIGKKLADWALGTDNRVLVSANAHTSGETVANMTDKTGMAVGTGGITSASFAAGAINDAATATDFENAIRDAVWAKVVEAQGSYTAQQVLSVYLAVLAGITADAGATLKTPNGVAIRVAATVNGSNERTAMTLTPSA
jgi:hypothetical protein